VFLDKIDESRVSFDHGINETSYRANVKLRRGIFAKILRENADCSGAALKSGPERTTLNSGSKRGENVG